MEDFGRLKERSKVTNHLGKGSILVYLVQWRKDFIRVLKIHISRNTVAVLAANLASFISHD